MMNVSLTNEVILLYDCYEKYSQKYNQGPVTFTIDSRKFEYVDASSSTDSAPRAKAKKPKKGTPHSVNETTAL